MKFNKLLLCTFITVLTGFLLTACQKNITTSYINDPTGKEISITTSDDTYTFKLPAVETEEIPSSEPITDADESEALENTAEDTRESEGPKTGEP